MVKLYIISLIQGSMTIYSPSVGKNQVMLKMTFLFGLIIIGNVIDNVSNPKWVCIFLQATLGMTWIITGFLVLVEEDDYEQKT